MDRYVPICENPRFSQAVRPGEELCDTVGGHLCAGACGGRTFGWGLPPAKKIGNAVQRNRSRRVIREAFRALQQEIRPGTEMVLVARGRTPFAKSTAVRKGSAFGTKKKPAYWKGKNG